MLIYIHNIDIFFVEVNTFPGEEQSNAIRLKTQRICSEDKKQVFSADPYDRSRAW